LPDHWSPKVQRGSRRRHKNLKTTVVRVEEGNIETGKPQPPCWINNCVES